MTPAHWLSLWRYVLVNVNRLLRLGSVTQAVWSLSICAECVCLHLLELVLHAVRLQQTLASVIPHVRSSMTSVPASPHAQPSVRTRSGVETVTGAVMPILTSVVSVSPSTALQLLLAQQQLEGQQQQQQGEQQQHQPPRARGGAGMP